VLGKAFPLLDKQWAGVASRNRCLLLAVAGFRSGHAECVAAVAVDGGKFAEAQNGRKFRRSADEHSAGFADRPCSVAGAGASDSGKCRLRTYAEKYFSRFTRVEADDDEEVIGENLQFRPLGDIEYVLGHEGVDVVVAADTVDHFGAESVDVDPADGAALRACM
jgi:hypothetical protein